MTTMTATTMMNTPLREVRLYGELGRKFGRVHRLAVESVREAMQALAVVLPGFERHLREHSAPGYHVFIGQRARGRDIGERQLEEPVSAAEPIMLVPVVAGAKKAGAFQAVLGIALIALTAWNPLGAFAGAFAPLAGAGKLGAYLLIGGALQMASAPRKAASATRVENRSFGFDGPVNTDEEGLPVPVAIGRFIAGGARISAGIATDEMPLAGAGAGSGGMAPAVLPGWVQPDPYEILNA